MSAGSYARLLRQRPLGALFGASLVARLPWGMTGLAVILLVTSHGYSYARAGLVGAMYTAGSGVAGPVAGRAVDRLGRRTVVPALCAAWTALFAAMWSTAGRSFPALMLLAALAGLATPPTTAVVRATWPELLEGAALQTMYALDATFQELAFVVGPALVAVVVAEAGAGPALLLAAALGSVGLITFCLHPAGDRPGNSDTKRLRITAEPRLVALLVVAALVVAGLQAIDIPVVAASGGRHHAGTAGLLFALWAAGSLVGGLLWGNRLSTGVPLVVLLLLVAVHMASLTLAPGPGVLGVLLFVGGTTISPTMAALYSAVGETAGPAATEAFGWMSGAFVAGGAGGNALSGLVLTAAGSRASFAMAGGFVALAALFTSRKSARLPSPEAVE